MDPEGLTVEKNQRTSGCSNCSRIYLPRCLLQCRLLNGNHTGTQTRRIRPGVGFAGVWAYGAQEGPVGLMSPGVSRSTHLTLEARVI